MAIVFTLKSFALNNTRAVHEDTDYVAAALTRNGQLVSPQVKKIGDVNNGTFQVGMSFKIPSTYSTADKFTFSYLVINRGGGKTQEVSQACLNALTQTPLTTFDPAEAAIVSVNGFNLPNCLESTLRAGDNLVFWWNQIKQQFANIESNMCDGPVAIDRFSFTGDSLVSLQLLSKPNPFSIIYLGMDSAVGCGSNSHYSVQWGLDTVVDSQEFEREITQLAVERVRPGA